MPRRVRIVIRDGRKTMPQSQPTRRMVQMKVLETSGVDRPAHGFDGWLVQKSAAPTDIARLQNLVRTGATMPTMESIKDEIRKSKAPAAAIEALTKAIDLQPDVDAAASLWQSLRAKLEAGDPDVPTTTDQEGAAAGAPAVDPNAAAAAPAPAAAVAATPVTDPSQLFKSVADPDVRELLIKQQVMYSEMEKQRDEALSKARQAEEAALDDAAIRKSREDFAHLAIDHDVLAPQLRKMALTDEAGAQSMRESLVKAEAQMVAAGVFAEVGTSQPGVKATEGAMAKARVLADAAVTAGTETNLAKALADVWKKNPDLYAEYEAEQKGDR